MIQVNIHQAKNGLSRHVERVAAAETIVLCRHRPTAGGPNGAEARRWEQGAAPRVRDSRRGPCRQVERAEKDRHTFDDGGPGFGVELEAFSRCSPGNSTMRPTTTSVPR